MTGPPVTMLQAVFVSHWAEAAGELIADDLLSALPAAPRMTAGTPPGSDSAGSGTAAHNSPEGLAGFMASPATLGSTVAERTLALSIAAARETLFVANAYFVPDDDLVRMLCASARTGVDVRVLTNGEKTDVPAVWRAGRHRYEELLDCGVRIYEYEPTVLHSKTLVADGAWSVVGTINFDNRSLAFNNEVSILALDVVLGARLDSLFLADLEHAVDIQLDAFRQRSLWQKLLERGTALFSRWL
jgi:cardiolipin synthase